MIIAVNCRLLLKNQLEGIGWFAYETLKRITRDHPEHQFIFIFDRPYDPGFIFGDNVQPVVAGPPTRHPLLWYIWFEWRIPRLLRKLHPDLFFSPDGFLSLRIPVRSITVIHDINFAHRPKDLPWWPRIYYNFFFPRFAGKAEKILTVSEYSKQDIHKTYHIPESRIRVVYNGAHEKYRPLPEEEIQKVRDHYSGGTPYFIFIGSLHPRKNLINLLKAFQLFCKQLKSEIKMVIVGEQMWHTSSAKQYLKNERVIRTGRLEPGQLRQVLGAALALTFVPWFEGFGIPVVEAMQAGVPVLTSHVTSLPEVGGDAVLYADPGSVEEITAQMKKLATKPELRRNLIEKGLKQAGNFSWDETAKRVSEEVIKELEG
ncbi:MAG: glycosyltransferase family 4 protein [Bacteroidales bacterium]|nr:glycosyltransferase family 4 protein [Bacteroidales bacterium]